MPSFFFFSFFSFTVSMMTRRNPLIKTLIYPYLTMILVASQTLAFMPLLSKSKTHQDITNDAILQTTADICRSRALEEGRDFVLVNQSFYFISNI